MRFPAITAALLTGAIALAGCGFKGPLYLDEDPATARKPAAVKPAPQREPAAPTENAPVPQ